MVAAIPQNIPPCKNPNKYMEAKRTEINTESRKKYASPLVQVYIVFFIQLLLNQENPIYLAISTAE